MSEPINPLPCPFCGIGGSVWYIEDDSKTPREFFVECAVCKATGQRTGQKETAIVGWNRRRYTDPRLAELRAIAEDFSKLCGTDWPDEREAQRDFIEWKGRNPE
jgi:Lar family restriction alleviation protein